MRVKIRLDTLTDVHNFVAAVSQVPAKVLLIDGAENCVSAKSLLGALYSLEWDTILCTCEQDITTKLMPWLA